MRVVLCLFSSQKSTTIAFFIDYVIIQGLKVLHMYVYSIMDTSYNVYNNMLHLIEFKLHFINALDVTFSYKDSRHFETMRIKHYACTLITSLYVSSMLQN